MKILNLCFIYDLESPYNYMTKEVVDKINSYDNIIPINCGSCLKQCGYIKDIKNVVNDNSGDNISDLNPYVGEMTGLYYFIKNVKIPDDVTHIGTCNYRRFFKQEDIQDLDIIDMYNKDIFPMSIYKQYCTNKNHSKDLFDILIQIEDQRTGGMASKYFHDNLQIFKQANMSIMRKDLFIKWANYILYIMSIAMKIVNPKQTLQNIPDEDKRIISFVLERMTSFWIDLHVISMKLTHKTVFDIDFLKTKPW